MKKTLYLLLILAVLFITIQCTKDSPTQDSTNIGASSLTVFDEILFYDGYAETVDEPVDEGITRVSNSKYVKQVDNSFISGVNSTLEMEIIVKAGCDNYDRIGNVYLSFIEKGNSYSESDIVYKIEIARFITPFMDKNESPTEVPYEFEIDNIAALFNDNNITDKYNVWMEFDIFGVPYAANVQIDGCEGECYTFYGTVTLNSGEEAFEGSSQYFMPLACFDSLNNYKNSDVIGETTKSIDIQLDDAATDAELYVITSNHGSNSGGEEYNRRNHYIYFDGNLVGSYIPGGESCEPFRKYNTQTNGIYGTSERTDSEWASFSNWCPGDKIPIRVFEVGDLEAGTHTFNIQVPDAKFKGEQGNIPLSVYIQGNK